MAIPKVPVPRPMDSATCQRFDRYAMYASHAALYGCTRAELTNHARKLSELARARNGQLNCKKQDKYAKKNTVVN